MIELPSETTEVDFDFFEHHAKLLLGDGWSIGRRVIENPEFARFLAEEKSNGSQHAIKVVRRSAVSPGLILRMQHDVRKLSGADCPGLAAPTRMELNDEALCVTWPAAAGRSLDHAFRDSKMGVEDALELATALLTSLEFMHTRGVLHRQIWPGSIVKPSSSAALGEDVFVFSQIKLVDVGTSFVTTCENRNSQHSLNIVRYLAPESLGAIECDITPSSDLYSVGVTLFKLMTGLHPFDGETTGEIIFSHMTRDLPDFGTDVPEVVQAFVRRLVAKDPGSRYQTAVGALRDVRMIRDSLESGVELPIAELGRNDHRTELVTPALVGREEQLKEISSAFARSAKGVSSFIAVEGISGAGKSRTLLEVERMAVRENFWALRATADPGRAAESMLAQVIEKMVRRADGDEGFRSRVADQLRSGFSVAFAAFPQLAKILPDVDLPSNATSVDRPRQIDAITRLLASLGTAAEPLLLLMDDCHWADDFAVAVFRRLSSHRSEHMVLITSYRGDEVPENADLRKIETTDRVEIGPLGKDDLVLLLESMAGTLPVEATDRIVSASQGSPFLASALLRGLVETGALTSIDGKWSLDESQKEVFTSSYDAAEIIAKRVDLLSPACRRLLTVGALLGMEFDLHCAVAIAGVPGDQVMQVIEDARARQLIWVQRGEATVAFVHDRIRQSLTNAQSMEAIQCVHLEIAEYLQHTRPEDDASIANHFHACGQPRRAFPHAVAAASAARERFAFDVAVTQYQIGYDALDDLGVEREAGYQVAFGLGSACLQRGDYASAEAPLQHAVELAVSPYEQAQSIGKLGELAQVTGATSVAIKRFKAALKPLGVKVPRYRVGFVCLFVVEVFVQALHSLWPGFFLRSLDRPAKDTERLQLSLLSGLATAYWYQGSTSQKLWTHLRCMNFGERFRPGSELARSYADHAIGMTLFGWTSRGSKYSERSYAICEEIDDISGQGYSLFTFAVVLLADARFEDVIGKCREALPLLERMGDYYWSQLTRYQLATAYKYLGRDEDAWNEASRIYSFAMNIGDHQSSGVVVDALAKAGADPGFEQILATELSRPIVDTQRTSHVLLGKAIWLLEQNKLVEAVSSLETSIGHFEKSEVFNFYTVENYIWLAKAYRMRAELTSPRMPHERAAHLQSAAKAAKTAFRYFYLCKPNRPFLYREWAIIQSLKGNRNAARRYFRKSLKWAAKLGERQGMGETCIEFGEFLIAEGDGRGGRLVELGRRRVDGTRRIRQGSADEASSASSFSLADRFDTVLGSGRKIASALSESEVFEHAREAAMQLLRGEKCAVFRVMEVTGSSPVEWMSGDSDVQVDLAILQQSVQTEQTAVRSDFDGDEGSTICIPIRVRDRVEACIYMIHSGVRDLFGHDERRLASFVTAIAGAACENAEGFAQLQTLNATLEQRVAERTADAQAANQAKSRFLATMTHEIRTPMNGILGMTELALNTELDSTQQGYLTAAKQSGKSLLSLLNDVLDLSKIEAGKMELEAIDFELREVIEESLGVMAPLAAGKSIELIHRISADLPVRIVGDPTRLRQVIVNLVGNAVKFTESGHVILDATRVRGARSDTLRMVIHDTGIGIPSDKLDTVFEAFRQSDHSTTRKFGGTGLGLSITAEIIDLMGGAVQVESALGEGSRFTIDIPLDPAADAGVDLRVPDELIGATALVIGNYEPGRTAVAETLEQFGLVTGVACLDDDNLQSCVASSDFVVFDLGVGEAATEAAIEIVEKLHDCTDGRWVVLAAADGAASRLDPKLDVVLKPVRSATLFELLVHTTDKMNEECEDDGKVVAEIPRQAARILVADDGRVNREVARGLLKLRGYEVTCVDNGRLAVEAYSDGKFDVILMDLEMPEMDGLEATTQIRALEAETDRDPVAIFSMTAHKVESYRNDFKEGDLNGHLTKPIQPELLFAAIESVQVASVN